MRIGVVLLDFLFLLLGPKAPLRSRVLIRVCPQFAGAAEAFVSQTEGPGVWSQAREHPSHIPALLPVQSHAQLSGRHEERGQQPRPASRLMDGRSERRPDSDRCLCLQLLSSMTECLAVDVQSLGVWRQLYTKHLPQSR